MILKNEIKAKGLLYKEKEALMWSVAMEFASFPIISIKKDRIKQLILKMKTIPSYEPFEFQKNSINLLLEIIKNNNGACIFDETGLGKTITASTTAINLTDGRINIISPKSNQRNWKNVLKNTTNSFDIFTFVKPPTEPSEVLIIDEGHNLRNLKSKSFIKVFE